MTSTVDRPCVETDINSVLGKVRLILDSFTAESDELSLAELVRRSGVAKATVHRLASELMLWGLLERSGTRYRLGLRMFEMGQIVPRQRILRQAALPYMEDLLIATGETIHFAIHDGLDVLYVEKIIGHRGLDKESRVAGRLPLYCTATGKAILAYSPETLFFEVVGQGLRPVTRHTTVSAAVLRRQIERIRREHVAIEHEETRLGYSSMAVPVFGSSSVLAGALSVTAPTVRMNTGRVSGALRTAGHGISRTLQAMPPTPLSPAVPWLARGPVARPRPRGSPAASWLARDP